MSEPQKSSTAGPGLPPTVIEIIAQEERQDSKIFRISVAIAVVFHIVLFWMQWPSFAGAASAADQQKSKIYVVKQVKFKQPPKQEMQQIPKPKTKKVPIPDPTPDEPEPIRDEQKDENIDFVPDENLVLGVPDADGEARYIQLLMPDPWGNAYLANVDGLQAGTQRIKVLSAGPDGTIDTAPGQTKAHGDDLLINLF